MGEIKRAQELRIDEFSLQKVKESHETTLRLTSDMQEMKEQMNSMNASGEFQEVGSNHSGRLVVLFSVNQQRFQDLVPCWVATNA